MSDAWNIFGTDLQIGDATDGASTIYTSLGEPTSYGDLGYNAGTFPATNHRSISGFAEFVASKIKNWQTFEVECNFLPGNPTQNLTAGAVGVSAGGAMGLAGDGLNHDLRLALTDPDTTVLDFLSLVLSWRIVTGGLDGIPKIRYAFQPTGPLGMS